MRNIIRLVVAVFAMAFFLQIQGCSDLPTKEGNGSAEKVTEDTKNQSEVKKVEEAEPECD